MRVRVSHVLVLTHSTVRPSPLPRGSAECAGAVHTRPCTRYRVPQCVREDFATCACAWRRPRRSANVGLDLIHPHNASAPSSGLCPRLETLPPKVEWIISPMVRCSKHSRALLPAIARPQPNCSPTWPRSGRGDCSPQPGTRRCMRTVVGKLLYSDSGCSPSDTRAARCSSGARPARRHIRIPANYPPRGGLAPPTRPIPRPLWPRRTLRHPRRHSLVSAWRCSW